MTLVEMLVVLAVLVVAWIQVIGPRLSALPDAGTANLGRGDYRLAATDGSAFTQDSLKGAPSAVFFGFTHCPDVCPTDTAKLAEGLKAFEAAHPDKAALVQPIFVTVDPERDSKEALKEFTDTFHPRLLGRAVESVRTRQAGSQQRRNADRGQRQDRPPRVIFRKRHRRSRRKRH